MAKKKILNLPTTLTEQSWFYEANREVLEPYLGQPYLSHSSAESWSEYRDDFIKQKFANIKLPQGIYGNLGNFVGGALEVGEFPKENPHGFIGQENIDFDKLRPEGAEYEKLIIIPRDGYFILGFIDKYVEDGNKAEILDFKTGGKNKEDKYIGRDYIQVILYAHAIYLLGKEISKTSVYFIRREGSHINPPLKISDEQFEIDLAFNQDRVDFALAKMDRIAGEISECYETYLKVFGVKN